MVLSLGRRVNLSTKNSSDIVPPESRAAPWPCWGLSNVQKSILTPEKIHFSNLPGVSLALSRPSSVRPSDSSPFECPRGKSDLKVGDYQSIKHRRNRCRICDRRQKITVICSKILGISVVFLVFAIYRKNTPKKFSPAAGKNIHVDKNNTESWGRAAEIFSHLYALHKKFPLKNHICTQHFIHHRHHKSFIYGILPRFPYIGFSLWDSFSEIHI